MTDTGRPREPAAQDCRFQLDRRRRREVEEISTIVEVAAVFRASELLLCNRGPRVGENVHFERSTDAARFAEGTSLFLFSVALVAVAIIVLFSIASISQLDTSKATLKRSSIDNSLLDDKVIGTVVSYPDSNASPVSAQTKSPSSSDADNTPSSTPVPPPSGCAAIVAEPALMLTPDRKFQYGNRDRLDGVRPPSRRLRPTNCAAG
jgi:hypothetical protein